MIPGDRRPRGRCVVFRNGVEREPERLRRLALRGDREALERLLRLASERGSAPPEVWILVEELRSSTHPRARIERWYVVGTYADEDEAWAEAIGRMLHWSGCREAEELRTAGDYRRAVEAWHLAKPSYPGRFHVLRQRVGGR